MMVDWAGRHNYQLNSAIVLRDLYRLLTMAMADQPLMAAAERRDDPLRSLRDQFIEDEVIHLLVSTAIANRIHLEHLRGPREDPDEAGFQLIAHICGELQPDADDAAKKPLLLHEACHKIIHAENIVVQTEGNPENTPWRRQLDITLRGQLGRRTWVAHLLLIEYARASVRNFGAMM
ncbi:hypothetical protein [Labrys neptuniae]